MVSNRIETDILQAWQEYRANPTLEMRNRLVEHYMPLVKYNGERIWARLPDGVELDDLVSAGIFGLLDAIEAFDLSRCVKFETYCVPRIRGAMLDELRTMDWVPRLVRSKQSKMDAAQKSLETALGRKPTDICRTRAASLPIALGLASSSFAACSTFCTAFAGGAVATESTSVLNCWRATKSGGSALVLSWSQAAFGSGGTRLR